MQFGSCCCRANTSCEAKQIPNSFQKHHCCCQRPKTHSRKMLFSTKMSSTVNDTCPDMMASCSFPENTKNHVSYLVRRRDLVKTNHISSASYLLVNSRDKCSMHSSPNTVTAHWVYPYTSIGCLFALFLWSAGWFSGSCLVSFFVLLCRVSLPFFSWFLVSH